MPVATTAPRALYVTARSAIDSEPPYERDESPRDGTAHVIGSLALAVTAPACERVEAPQAAAPTRRLLELVPTRVQPAVAHRIDELFDVVRTARAELPAPGPRAGVLVGAIMETLTGRRPVTQLVRWLTTDVYEELEVNIDADRSRVWAGRLRRLIVSEPADGVAEVTAVVERGPRTRALALRMEGRDGRWVVTALQMG